MTPDSELLRRFAKTNSQDAFAELMKRHVNLVYSAALRQVGGDEHFAKDVSQMVFADLARKANSLSRRETLTGWLYTSAHFAAAKVARTENRRHDREEKFMRETIHETAPEADWEKLRPALDEVMHELKETDREAILLRYFENRQFAEVGAKLGLNENAARMRVERALEKLRAVFAKRGLATTSALAAAISANAVQIAPVGLVTTLTTASIASAGTGTFTLLKIMTMAKLKLGISALVVAGAATAFVVQHQSQTKLRDQSESLRQQITQLETNNEGLSNRLAAIGDSKSLSGEQFNELLKLRGEVGVLRQQIGKLGQLRDENQQLRVQNASKNQGVQISEGDYFRLHSRDVIDNAKLIELAMLLHANDHDGFYPTNLNQLVGGPLGSSNLTGGIQLNDYELVNAGVPQAREKYPQMLTLREKAPRQTPDRERWERIYGLADGSVETIYGRTPDANQFITFEAQHSPPPNQ
jgi:RNA polymerase sigma factor (sigma-70 family)